MRVLWLCNIMLPVIAGQLGMEASNKEGWLSGLADIVLAGREKNGIELSVAFPIGGESLPQKDGEGSILRGCVTRGGATLTYYGFPEDTRNPEKYDEGLEPILKKIVDMVRPDVVHCFGTEYPHTLAMCRAVPEKRKLLLGLQGLCTLYAQAYFADLPEEVINSVTLRDWLKKDSIRQQKEKFVLRGKMEREAIALAGNVTGRTQWDRKSAEAWNPKARYHKMNETLRPGFYGPVWQEEKCIPHSIFLSQGDYPLKGLHYMLLALPRILTEYPDTKVYVAGNSLVGYRTWKEKLKISAYGQYLRSLLKSGGLEDRVVFLGRLDEAQMLDRYLKSSLFVCPSALENSPNSLGEAMLLGMPCVSADVGGISSIFTGGEDGLLYEGHASAGERGSEGNTGAEDAVEVQGSRRLEEISRCLAEAVIRMWDNPEERKRYCVNARKHALNTHNREENNRRLVEIYEDIL